MAERLLAVAIRALDSDERSGSTARGATWTGRGCGDGQDGVGGMSEGRGRRMGKGMRLLGARRGDAVIWGASIGMGRVVVLIGIVDSLLAAFAVRDGECLLAEATDESLSGHDLAEDGPAFFCPCCSALRNGAVLLDDLDFKGHICGRASALGGMVCCCRVRVC